MWPWEILKWWSSGDDNFFLLIKFCIGLRLKMKFFVIFFFVHQLLMIPLKLRPQGPRKIPTMPTPNNGPDCTQCTLSAIGVFHLSVYCCTSSVFCVPYWKITWVFCTWCGTRARVIRDELVVVIAINNRACCKIKTIRVPHKLCSL